MSEVLAFLDSRRWRSATFGAVALMAFMVPAHNDAAASETGKYLIRAGDLLNISVYQWPEHSGEVRVDIDGAISRPAVGRISAAGQTLDKLEASLRAELAQRVDLKNAAVVVSVVEYRPIAVLGAVNNPGRHRFEVGLTVLDALALSGGPLSLSPRNLNTFDQAVRQMQFYEQEGTAKMDLLSAMVRRERLLAEKENREAFEISGSLAASLKDSDLEEIAAQEKALFDSRRKSFIDQKSQFTQQAQLHKEEIESLDAHSKEVFKAIAKVDMEYKRLQDLLEKGLIRRIDLVTVDNQLTNLQSNLRSAIVAHANARADMSRAQASFSELVQTRESEIEKELLETDKTIRTLELRQSTRASISPKGFEISGESSDGESMNIEGLTFKIMRKDPSGKLISMTVDGGDAILPGDVLTVALSKQSF